MEWNVYTINGAVVAGKMLGEKMLRWGYRDEKKVILSFEQCPRDGAVAFVRRGLHRIETSSFLADRGVHWVSPKGKAVFGDYLDRKPGNRLGRSEIAEILAFGIYDEFFSSGEDSETILENHGWTLVIDGRIRRSNPSCRPWLHSEVILTAALAKIPTRPRMNRCDVDFVDFLHDQGLVARDVIHGKKANSILEAGLLRLGNALKAGRN